MPQARERVLAGPQLHHDATQELQIICHRPPTQAIFLQILTDPDFGANMQLDVRNVVRPKLRAHATQHGEHLRFKGAAPAQGCCRVLAATIPDCKAWTCHFDIRSPVKTLCNTQSCLIW